MANDVSGSAGVAGQKTFFGHPRGLATLFFTEMWERFSYYGMRGLLILFMTTTTIGENPGLGFDVSKAAAIYGLYTALVYLLTLAGGWIADNLWGQRRAVFVGGCIIAAGHFSMVVPTLPFFYLGLLLIIIGTGLLKPNVSTMVGDLYPEGGARRDAGFSIFYMGINLGAFLGPMLCGLLGESYNWHFGFSLAGIGMVMGLIQYKIQDRYLGEVGYLRDTDPTTLTRRYRTFYLVLAVALATIASFGFVANLIGLGLNTIATWLGYGIIELVVIYFVYLTLGKRDVLINLVVTVAAYVLVNATTDLVVDRVVMVALGVSILLFVGTNVAHIASSKYEVTLERKRLLVIFWLFVLVAIFWSGFEQAGSSMNLFAKDLTDRNFGTWEMPASWLQSVNAIFIIIFAPIFGVLWVTLARRNANPSIPVKFGLGLLGLAGGFFVLAWGAANATPDAPVSPAWLVVTYFLHTCGELSLSPVGLSSVTKLAPHNRVGQMMGIWFVGAALGNLIAGLVAGRLEGLAHDVLFWNVALIIGGAGIVALLISPAVKKLMGDVK